ncbi:MAG TPA: NAD(P)-dependent oxidoreductase [Alphaproteobacteria bacterium]|nr:NAD(P)-dependent oxidoreductase [Alphaproteobacteria bacterium]
MSDSATPLSTPPGHLLCFGLGFSARATVRLLRARGWRISATCRDPARGRELSARGIASFQFNDGGSLPDAAWQGVTHLLISVPPGEAGDPVLGALRDTLIARRAQFQWIGYLSTTGVYGDRQGGWVDETTPPDPAPGRSARRAAAERDWCDLYRDHGLPVHMFRLAGIYGPGRNALLTAKAGQARRIDKAGQVFCRIHVDDIAQTLAASIARPDPGAVYNVCDDEPAPNHQIVALACELAGVPVPPLIPFEAADLSPMAKSFYNDCRRVRNDRIKADLGVRLDYPTYREGLAALCDNPEEVPL